MELLTVKDLEKFKAELLREIRNLLLQKSAIEKKLLKTNEVCKLMGLKPGTLQNLRKNETIAFRKIGGTIYYTYENAERLL
ncbi:MAG: helix-turn-helix domain-containing protein [Candidatus Nitrosocosmicus sp.]